MIAILSCKNKTTPKSIESSNDTKLNSANNSDESQNNDFEPVSGLGASFSPDGTQIAFYSYIEEGKGVIFIMDTDGLNKKIISSDAPDGLHTEPTWSPDGSKIAFTNFIEGQGAKLAQVNSDGTGFKKLPSISDKGYHMFGSWDISGDGYYFFHWPEGGFEPNVYHCNGEVVSQITTDNISCRPEMDANGSLYINKIVDLEKNIFHKYKVSKSGEEGFSFQKIESLEGVVMGKNAIKVKENDSTTTLVLENLNGKDLKELAEIPYKGIMFPRYDREMENIIYNTGFSDGTEIHMLKLATGEVVNLVAEKQ